MGFQILGKIHAVFDVNQISERFRKREFVLELAENPNYPQFVMFQLTGDRCEKLDAVSVGQEVEVEFSVRGREWTSPQGDVKYFNSLDVWDIQEGAGSDKASRSSGASKGSGALEEPSALRDLPPVSDDDVPF